MTTTKEKNFLVKLLSIEVLTAIVFFVIALSAFMFIADEIVIEKEDLFDSRVFEYTWQFSTPAHDRIALFITSLGTFLFLVPAYLGIGIYLSLKKKRRYAITIGVISVLSLLLGFVLKEVFHRQRPLLKHLDPVIGYSFPSGHTMAAFTFSGIMIYLLWNARIPVYARALGTVFFFLLAVAIGLSRIYLHVHFASDVIGGFCVTVGWLSMCFVAMQYAHHRGWL